MTKLETKTKDKNIIFVFIFVSSFVRFLYLFASFCIFYVRKDKEKIRLLLFLLSKNKEARFPSLFYFVKLRKPLDLLISLSYE